MLEKIKFSSIPLDKNTGVYVLKTKGCKEFEYSDGGEEKLLKIIKMVSDKSTNSLQLEFQIDDWPTRYHLSNLRTNIFRALNFLNRDSDILEIGAGCGALTRYLGENFKSVDAIEGNLKRALIIKERCRDLINVNVYCTPLQNVIFDKEYNVVTLIGVLEYAPIYYSAHINNPEKACLEMLKKALDPLKDDGYLILAIENRFGLKYWSGCHEDHTGKLYDSIHGYPDKEKSVITFSRSELRRLLEKAGINYYEFFYPFPDYKLTNTVIREIQNPANYYLHNWIKSPFDDYSQFRHFFINEALAIRSLVKAEMIYDFANSFLVVASKRKEIFGKGLEQNWIVKRFSTNRILPFRTLTILKNEKELNSLIVSKQKLNDFKEPETFIKLNISDLKWIPGDLLQYSLYESIYKNNGFRSLINIFTKYQNELIKKCIKGKIDNEGYPIVNLDALDFVPQNIIVNDLGMFDIDQEWISTIPISADYILFRAISLFAYEQYPYIFKYLSTPNDNIDSFIISIMKVFYPNYDIMRHELNKKREEEFQTIVSGNIFKMPTIEKFREGKDFLLHKDALINSLLNSWSWKITFPLKSLYKFYLQVRGKK